VGGGGSEEGEGGDSIVWQQSTMVCVHAPLQYNTTYGVRMYHGAMGSRAREKASEDFNNNPEVNVLLVSLMAGGVGLNLVAASRVVLYDPDWNPANDLQVCLAPQKLGLSAHTWVFSMQWSLRHLFYVTTASRHKIARFA
jgi:hypothetical protein